MKRLHKVLAVSAAAALLSTAIIAAGEGTAFATVESCNSGTKNWAALYPSASAWLLGVDATACIGNKGTFAVSGSYSPTQVFCAGNNSGIDWYFDETKGTYADHTFWPDTSYYVSNGTYKTTPGDDIWGNIDQLDVYQVEITGWSGSAGC